MRTRGDPLEPVVLSGQIHRVEATIKGGPAITQAEQGEQIQWRIQYSLLGSPSYETFRAVFEIANPDKPGTTWTGIWVNAPGDGRTLTALTTGVLMPNRDMRYYVTFWDQNWKLLDESNVQTIRYVPPPPPPPPVEPPPPPPPVEPPPPPDEIAPPPEVEPPPEIEPPPDEVPPPEGPPVWQPLRYLIWLMFGQG